MCVFLGLEILVFAVLFVFVFICRCVVFAIAADPLNEKKVSTSAIELLSLMKNVRWDSTWWTSMLYSFIFVMEQNNK